MKVLLTDHLLRDLESIPRPLATKTQRLAVEMTRIARHELSERLTAGWRIHQLKVSPFMSLSLDMNFRLLCRLDGESITLHRIVKHDLADNPAVNRNASRPGSVAISGQSIGVVDLYSSLLAIGLDSVTLEPFAKVQTVEGLLAALEKVPASVADLALSLIESQPFVYTPTQYRVLNDDEDFMTALEQEAQRWALYLHPYQDFIVRQPLDRHLLVEGGAGTGKTVCAWYRAKHVVDAGGKVVFACPTHLALAASRNHLSTLLDQSLSRCRLIASGNPQQLAQALEGACHLIVDEGQDLSPAWYEKMALIVGQRPLGVTVFVDRNQRRFGPTPRDRAVREAELRVETLAKLLRAETFQLTLNYRNARQIAEYFVGRVNSMLPAQIRMDVPLFEAAPVFEKKVATEADAFALTRMILAEICREFNPSDVALVVTGRPGVETKLVGFLEDLRTPVTKDVESSHGVLVARPHAIKGHERKAVICLLPHLASESKRTDRAVELYIMLSRARDRLFVIEYDEFP